jgi:hypothetical protein
MQYTRQEALTKLLKSYESYYNIIPADEGQRPLVARCEFFEHSQKYVLSKKAELWSADCEEFIYLFDVPHLTKEIYEECQDYAHKDGMERLHIGPGHMYSYITPIFICDICDEDARKALKKCRIYKSFHFSLHGWMDFHTVLAELGSGRVEANRNGRSVAKILKKVLFQSKK